MKVILSIFALGALAPLMLLLPEALARTLAMFSPFLSGLVAWTYWRATGGAHGHRRRARLELKHNTA